MNKIPLCTPFTDDDEASAMVEALRSGWLAHGSYNKQLERRFCELLGVEHAISMNSCTAALFLALLANDIRGEVLIPSFTFVATANAVVTAGGTPCLVDIDEATCNLDPRAIEAKITADTEALMVVHYAGQPAAMDAITKIAQKRGLLLIEDSAETLNATFAGKQAGSFGVGCFSFFPTKNITTGEGGMLTTDDSALASRCRALMGHGIPKDTLARQKSRRPWNRDAHHAGYNFRLSNVLAAIGCAQMDKLAQITALRQERGNALSQALAPLASAGHIRLPHVHPEATHVYQMYTIQVTEPAVRDNLVDALIADGIGASVHFDPPVHQQTFYRDYFAGRPARLTDDLRRTDAVASRIVTLPLYPAMTLDDTHRIAESVAGFFE